MSKRNQETRILNYFETAPVEAARAVYHMAGAIVKRRTPSEQAPAKTRKPRKPRKAQQESSPVANAA